MRSKSFLARLPILGLSFFLAMTLFLFVQTQNAPTKGPVNVLLRVQAEKLSSQLYAYVPTQFQVAVSGPADAVDQFVSDPSQTTAVFDLSGAAPGAYEALVRVVAPSNVHLEFSYKRTFKVRVVPIITRTGVAVTAGSTNQLPQSLKNYRLSRFEVSPETVTLSGPSDQINGIIPKVIIDLGQVTSVSYQRTVQVQLLDGQGAFNHLVTAEPAVVSVVPVLVPLPQTKQIILNAQFTGELAPGLSIDSYSISPQVVTVSGQSEELARILTAPVVISLSSLHSGVQTIQVVPKLPRGVVLQGAKKAAEVEIVVSKSELPKTPPAADTTTPPSPGGAVR